MAHLDMPNKANIDSMVSETLSKFIEGIFLGNSRNKAQIRRVGQTNGVTFITQGISHDARFVPRIFAKR
jgi:hypothetical protein